MTAQIPEIVIYKSDKFDLIGMTGRGLFVPSDFGMVSGSPHTACWRGFYSTYEITEGRLFLKNMKVYEKDGNYKPINNVMPKEGLYSNINLPASFTGKLRLAKDFNKEFYVHMGFQKASAFGVVLDLTFEEGHLKDVNDRSKELEDKRGEFKKRYESEDLIRGIDEAFSLDMDLE